MPSISSDWEKNDHQTVLTGFGVKQDSEEEYLGNKR
jgi:hypothetical protein